MPIEATNIRELPYSAGIMSQSSWFVEFKKYVELLSSGVSPEQIKESVVRDNLFGVPNDYRAKRLYGYISNRVNKLDQMEMKLFLSSDLSTQKLLNLICILRGDRLFYEFIDEVYREKYIVGIDSLERNDVNAFFTGKEAQSDLIMGWNDTTKRRIGSCYINFLTDANLLTVIGKEKRITPPLVDIALERYLASKGEGYLLKALTGVA